MPNVEVLKGNTEVIKPIQIRGGSESLKDVKKNVEKIEGK
jgi:hypothetical protein